MQKPPARIVIMDIASDICIAEIGSWEEIPTSANGELDFSQWSEQEVETSWIELPASFSVIGLNREQITDIMVGYLDPYPYN